MVENNRYRDALRTPSEVYPHPGAVVRDTALSDTQKLEILRHWEAEAVQLQESEAEGFAGGEKSLLADIKKAEREIRGE